MRMQRSPQTTTLRCSKKVRGTDTSAGRPAGHWACNTYLATYFITYVIVSIYICPARCAQTATHALQKSGWGVVALHAVSLATLVHGRGMCNYGAVHVPRPYMLGARITCRCSPALPGA